MTDEFYIDDRQEKQLDEIMLILREMDRANMNRDSDIKRYCVSVETIILNLPRSIKYKAYGHMKELGLERGRYGSITEDKLVLYDDLNNYIRDQLEKQKQMWVKKETKTFE
jgi:hypothetical protein